MIVLRVPHQAVGTLLAVGRTARAMVEVIAGHGVLGGGRGVWGRNTEGIVMNSWKATVSMEWYTRLNCFREEGDWEYVKNQ